MMKMKHLVDTLGVCVSKHQELPASKNEDLWTRNKPFPVETSCSSFNAIDALTFSPEPEGRKLKPQESEDVRHWVEK